MTMYMLQMYKIGQVERKGNIFSLLRIHIY